MAGKGDQRRPEAEPGLFDAGYTLLDWHSGTKTVLIKTALTEEIIRKAIKLINKGYEREG